MKKIYLLAMSGLLSMPGIFAQSNVSIAECEEAATVSATEISAPLAQKPTKVIDKSTVLGEYHFYYTNRLNQTNGGPRMDTLNITAGDNANEVIIKGLIGWDLKGTYDAKTNKIIIPRQVVGKTDAGADQVFSQFITLPSMAVSEEPVEMVFDGISFKIDCAFGIPANEGLTSWYNLQVRSFGYKTGIIEWTKIGTAPFVDKVFGPMIGAGNKNLTLDVYICEDLPNWYRVDKFFSGNMTSNAYPMIINATNPNCVLIPFTPTGRVTSGRGNLNVASASVTFYPTDAIYLEKTSMTVNGVTYTAKEVNIWIENNVMKFGPYVMRFNWDDYKDSTGASLAGKWYYNASTAASEFTIPAYSGVKDVNVDNENAPVEYYNLQGIRLNEPTPGQVIIKRQGTKVEKIVR